MEFNTEKSLIMAFAVTERRNEMGIRMALGAENKDILGLIIKKAFILTVAGFLVGQIGALVVCRFATTLLYDISVYDPATLVLVPILLLGVAMIACYFPARRAAQLNPIETLRYE